MEIQGTHIKLTPSEAEWIGQKMRPIDKNLARRAIVARRLAAAPYIPVGLFDTIAAFPAAIEPHMSEEYFAHARRYYRAQRILLEAERVYAARPDGSELHTIDVAMSREELATLELRAAEHHLASLKDAVTSDQPGPETPEPNDDLSVAPGLLREELDEADVQQLRVAEFDRDLREMQVTAGIIAAIAAALYPEK